MRKTDDSDSMSQLRKHNKNPGQKEQTAVLSEEKNVLAKQMLNGWYNMLNSFFKVDMKIIFFYYNLHNSKNETVICSKTTLKLTLMNTLNSLAI